MPNKFAEPIPLKPFLDWFQKRVDVYTAECGGYESNYNPGIRMALEECGWESEAGARRYHRWRFESRTGLAERAVIEDALDHAGVGFWELYPEIVAEDERRWAEENVVELFPAWREREAA